MDNKCLFMSYTLAVASGICFLSGLIILSREGACTPEWNDSKGSYMC